jgi:hypothetical protein
VVPAPVAKMLTESPRAAGFAAEFTLKSEFKIAPGPVPELFSVNTPGATEATGSVTGAESAPKYSTCTWLGGTFLVSAGSVLLTSTLVRSAGVRM